MFQYVYMYMMFFANKHLNSACYFSLHIYICIYIYIYINMQTIFYPHKCVESIRLLHKSFLYIYIHVSSIKIRYIYIQASVCDHMYIWLQYSLLHYFCYFCETASGITLYIINPDTLNTNNIAYI